MDSAIMVVERRLLNPPICARPSLASSIQIVACLGYMDRWNFFFDGLWMPLAEFMRILASQAPTVVLAAM